MCIIQKGRCNITYNKYSITGGYLCIKSLNGTILRKCVTTIKETPIGVHGPIHVSGDRPSTRRSIAPSFTNCFYLGLQLFLTARNLGRFR